MWKEAVLSGSGYKFKNRFIFWGLSYISLDMTANTSFFISIYQVHTITFIVYFILFITSIMYSIQNCTKLQNKVFLYTIILHSS